MVFAVPVFHFAGCPSTHSGEELAGRVFEFWNDENGCQPFTAMGFKLDVNVTAFSVMTALLIARVALMATR